MELLIKEKCNECNGDGMIENKIWVEFFEQDNIKEKETGHYSTQQECEQWFNDRGYSKLPKEELVCSECDGQGHTERWVDMKEIVEELNHINFLANQNG